MEPIVAWRIWQIPTDGDKRLLHSISASAYGRYYSNNAWSRIRHHESDMVPVMKSKHGIHAWKHRHDAEKYCFNLVDTFDRHFGHHSKQIPELILGEVYLWGKIIEHRHGYRAQYAYPKKLIHDKRFNNLESIKELSRNYGIDYEIFKL